MNRPQLRFDRDWPDDRFDIVAPTGQPMPVVAHIPHASILIPASVREEILVDDAELELELIRLTDWYTDDLFDWLSGRGAMLFVNRLSRFVFDPERFLDDGLEETAARGQGVVYTHGTQRQRLRASSDTLRATRVEELYEPYHAALDRVVGQLLDTFDECLLIDCHSFPTTPLPSELDQAPDRPDICIGTDATHTPPPLAEAIEQAFTTAGFSVRRDTPFAGTFVPGGYYGRDARVHSVMIEIRRGLYIDEQTAERLPDYAAFKSSVEAAIASILPGSASSG